MSNRIRSASLYSHPFSKAYWQDATAEVRNLKMLVVAALLIALRVACKSLAIPLGPTLRINIAFVVNALGAMIFGPVLAGLGACVSDFLGVMMDGSIYFPPFMLVECAGSVIFGLFLYRARITPTRIILSRFCIDLFVNIGMNIPISILYYQMVLGKDLSTAVMVESVVKNVCMFPIESWILTVFLAFLVPVTYRMKLTFDGTADKNSLKFSRRQIITLVSLLLVGILGAGCYFVYDYNNTSLSASYTAEERYEANTRMTDIVLDRANSWEDETVVCIVESAYPEFGSDEVTYTVAVYIVDEQALAATEDTLESLLGLSRSPAASHPCLTRMATATVVVHGETGHVLRYSVTHIR